MKKKSNDNDEARYDTSYLDKLKVKHTGMDPIRYNDLKSIFAYIDLDKSGTIEIRELYKELKNLKDDESLQEYIQDLDAPLYDLADRIQKKLDINGDGFITFQEMVEAFTPKDLSDFKDREITDALYEKFCPDGKEELDVQTLKQIAADLGEDKNECERMIFYADADGDGIVSKDEFYDILNMKEDELIERGNAWNEHKSEDSKPASRKLKSKRRK